MPDYYLFDRAGIARDYITACRASELLVEAQESELETGLCGDLETGFCFWSLDPESGLRLIHYHVTPAPAEEVREDICNRGELIANA
jgi:hypothetical protein